MPRHMSRNAPKTIILEKIPLMIDAGVFNPDPQRTNSTAMLLRSLPNMKGKEVLDIGSGCGAVSIYCALNGAKHVTAADILLKAILNTKRNIDANLVADKVTIKESNLFDNITGTFDYIVGNLPISNRHWKLHIKTQDLLIRFLEGAQMHIRPSGAAFFSWCSMEPHEKVLDYIRSNHWRYIETKEFALNKTWYVIAVYF